MDEVALAAAFELLERSGYRPPYDGAEQMQATMQAWAAAWRGRSASDLRTALAEWLSRPSSRWWPKPGEVLALAPARPARQLEARTPLERAEELMGRVTTEMYQADPSGETSRVVLDQAIDDTMRACGQDRCIGVDCEPCTTALARRLEELWAERSMPATARRAV